MEHEFTKECLKMFGWVVDRVRPSREKLSFNDREDKLSQIHNNRVIWWHP
jgi:hypothetical protein